MFGDHAAYIVPAYVITATVLAGLFIWIRIGYARHKKDIAKLEEQGIARGAKTGSR